MPLYWMATLLFMLVAFAAIESEVAGIGAQQVVMSLFFIPFFNPTHEGAIWPILVLGWTLNFEMFFYAIFAVSSLSRRFLPVITIVIVFMVMAGLVLKYENALWIIYTSPLLLEFLAGVWLGYAHLHRDFSRIRPIFYFGVLGLLVSSFGFLGNWQPVMTGAFSFAIVAGVLGFEQHFREKPHWLAVLLGQASYSIYLTHIITLAFVFSAWKRLPLTGWLQFGGLMIFGLTACIVVGVMVHLLVEKPMTRWLSGIRLPHAASG